MDLTTTYMGLRLKNPLVISASPLSEEADNVRKMEDLGASAVVLYSLFEEQIIKDSYELDHHLSAAAESHAEALSYFTEPEVLHIGPEHYLEYIAALKKSVGIPIIGSLNGSTPGGWVEYARLIEEAGADALELNIYTIPTDPNLTALDVEQNYLDILKEVRAQVSIPIAVKLSPFFTSLANMVVKLENAGANALVLFNRFYQPDINPEELEVEPQILLSAHQALRLPLCWIGLLFGRTPLDLAATSGIHTVQDVIKMVMSGANVTMLCAALFRHGLHHIEVLEKGIGAWLDEHEYESMEQMRGNMSQLHCDNPAAFERAQYVQAVHTHFRIRE
ncbi:MAG: dihydroorotate dehydrogenase-like protein [SAR324 cluster bacterium]|nr:dihydroorotate dehydrogenase-like protein [SAR324 cluster bacterium]